MALGKQLGVGVLNHGSGLPIDTAVLCGYLHPMAHAAIVPLSRLTHIPPISVCQCYFQYLTCDFQCRLA